MRTTCNTLFRSWVLILTLYAIFFLASMATWPNDEPVVDRAYVQTLLSRRTPTPSESLPAKYMLNGTTFGKVYQQWQSSTSLSTTKKWSDDTHSSVGPWLCAFYENDHFQGDPAVVQYYSELRTEWQEKVGFGFDGVPELKGRQEHFSMQCATVKQFAASGTFSFLPYAKASGSVRIVVDGSDLVEAKRDNRILDASQIPPLLLKQGWHEIVFELSQTKKTRSWAVLSWVEVQNSKMDDDRAAACLGSPHCYHTRTICHNDDTDGLPRSESSWGVCREPEWDGVSKWKKAPGKCLAYSFGVRDIYKHELKLGAEGCEVHAFDCTVGETERSLGPNVILHPWCVTAPGATELLLDGNGKKVSPHLFMTMSAMVNKLGHANRKLTRLKMDCEGCEWPGLDDLAAKMPHFLAQVDILQLELHTDTFAHESHAFQLGRMAKVARALQPWTTYKYSVNAPTHRLKPSDNRMISALVQAGLHNNTGCYEFNMVRTALL